MPKKHHRKPSRLPQILAVCGLVLLVVVILLLKEKPSAVVPSAGLNELPEAQLQRALSQNRPTLAFFHSDNCQQCIVMMDTVDQVYPEFRESVTLVDVNVYDERNQPLIERVRLQYIPTLILFDQNGQGQTHVGVMESSQLSAALAKLAAGN